LAGDRQDLADREKEERTLLEAYLPAAPDEASVRKVVADVVAELSVTSMKDMGKVMALLKPRIQGRADMGAVSAMIKARLG